MILYGCGDFLNDYEGIGGHEAYRPDLTLMYLPTLDAETGELQSLRMVPMRIRHMRLLHAAPGDVQWLRDRLHEQCTPFGVSIELDENNDLIAKWE